MLAECTLMCSWTGPVDMVRREGGATRASIFLSLEQEMALFLLVPSTAVLVVFLRWPVPVEAVRAVRASEELWRSKGLRSSVLEHANCSFRPLRGSLE